MDILDKINGKGYKAYKDLEGTYDFRSYILSIDHVQGDPFAAPSRIRVIVSQENGRFPLEYFNENHKRIAVVDFLTRLFFKNIKRYYEKVKGSGKSGLLTIDYCGQEILDRTSIFINRNKVEARIELGLPAAGRRILGEEAKIVFFKAIPAIARESLYFDNIDKKALKKHIELVEDQVYIRSQLNRMKLCAFVANDSLLPRESGISQRPLKVNGVKFKSPESLQVEMNLPNKGHIKGMGIPKGITLVVGGGYHGKSTLLKALELGVYNHIEGDGREYVITEDSAVKIRAEDGRRIEKVDISMFINNLPNGKDTKRFSSENASGSTSEAANIIEALECGSRLLLIDEDTSATNFMVRDEKMERLVSKDKEPITPFIHRAKALYSKNEVSTILVIGSSGDYFSIADTIIMMDQYKAIDVTKSAKEICDEYTVYSNLDEEKLKSNFRRVILKRSFPEGAKGVKVKTINKDTILYNNSEIDLRYVEQLIHISQTNAIGEIIKYIKNNMKDENLTLCEMVDRVYIDISIRGLDIISSKKDVSGNLALPRKYEAVSALNRFRELKVK